MKTDYMARVSRAARWMLPWKEAEDVIADYRDMTGTPSRSEEALYRDLGRPWQAVKPLRQPKAYRLWAAVFAILSACILLPAAVPLTSVFRLFWRFDLSANRLWQVCLPAGLVLSLVWFRRQGGKSPRLSQAILPVLILLLAGLIAVWWFLGQLIVFPNGAIAQDPDLTRVFFGPASVPANRAGETIHIALAGLSIVSAVLGVAGLVMARVGDRRWLAAYTLGLTLIALSVSVLTFLTGMTLEYSTFLDDWWVRFLFRHLAITAVGLVGTGAALC